MELSTSAAKSKIVSGMNAYIKRIQNCEDMYVEILNSIPADCTDTFYKITDENMFNKILETFSTALSQKTAKEDLRRVYDIAIHTKSKSLVIANKGATLYSLSEKYETPYLVRHIGMCVYTPGMGMEYVNAGIVGDVYSNGIVVRTESACAPSFIFGSQRCNCHHQWKNVRELAASFNPINAPDIADGDEFEHWVQQQFKYENGKHIYQQKSNLGFAMLHIDSQNGMGSGYTPNEFVFDLSERAAIRHRGEYTSEQTFNTTMFGGFTSIGIDGDPRHEDNCLGYTITPVVLDFLGVNKKIILLTNNPYKLATTKSFGYDIIRVKSIGAVNVAGSTEASQRGSEFNHLDICGDHVSFEEDFQRMKAEISEVIKTPEYLN